MQLTPARLRAFLRDIEKVGGIDGCWIWTGATNCDGYPSGSGEKHGKGIPAHRIAYEWMVAPIPDGLQLDHLCRTPLCVNPHHLEPVTQSENVRRAHAAKRGEHVFELRRYCRRGHALIGENRRMYSNGPGQPRELRCYQCHKAGCAPKGGQHAA